MFLIIHVQLFSYQRRNSSEECFLHFQSQTTPKALGGMKKPSTACIVLKLDYLYIYRVVGIFNFNFKIYTTEMGIYSPPLEAHIALHNFCYFSYFTAIYCQHLK